MNDNVFKVITSILSFCLFVFAILILFKVVNSVDSVTYAYNHKYTSKGIIINENNMSNSISLKQAKSLIGELKFMHFREKSVEQVLYYEGELIKVSKDMDIPKLYMGSSDKYFDFDLGDPELIKNTYELSYVYSEDLEISGYRLK